VTHYSSVISVRDVLSFTFNLVTEAPKDGTHTLMMVLVP